MNICVRSRRKVSTSVKSAVPVFSLLVWLTSALRTSLWLRVSATCVTNRRLLLSRPRVWKTATRETPAALWVQSVRKLKLVDSVVIVSSGRQVSALSFVSTPERQAEEGRAGFRTDFSPGTVPVKPMNYPVGKPLEVIIRVVLVAVIYPNFWLVAHF